MRKSSKALSFVLQAIEDKWLFARLNFHGRRRDKGRYSSYNLISSVLE